MKIDEFINVCDFQATLLKKQTMDKSLSKDQEISILQALGMSLMFRDFAGAIKEENTNLLRAMPCSCDPLAPKQFNYKCERCKQLEEREKE